MATSTETASAAVERSGDGRLRHGAKSKTALAPQVVSMKKALLARMGLRQRDLDALAREHLDTYCRARAKVVAIDDWLETNPLIDADGRPPDIMRLYFVALNASTRSLEALRGVILDLDRGERDMGRALEALAREGRRIRTAQEGS